MMNIPTSEKHKTGVDKNILDLFWKLSDKNSKIRLNACADILHGVWKKQQAIENENELHKDLQYCIERLVKGLASSRNAARLGYTLLLTEILKTFDVVQIQEILELMKKHLTITGKQEKRDLVFGQLFGYAAIVRSGRLPNHAYLSEVITSLFELSFTRSYILNATYEIFLDIFLQLTSENFKDVWPCIKKKLPSDWETCSAQSFWLLLLCIRLFPNDISDSYMRKRWHSDIFALENVENLKKVMKQTTSSLPYLHPTCCEFVLLVKQRSDFHIIWNTVVDDNLFNEQNEKSFVGFEMIKFALEDSSIEELNVVLSPKFETTFSKCFNNPKHPLNPAATSLANFFCTFVKTKEPNMQISVLKLFLQPSGTVLDQILKKKEISLIIQSLLPDSVKKLCDFLKTLFLKKKSLENNYREVNNMKRFQAIQQIGNLTVHPTVLSDLDWRTDVIKFLFLHSFFTTKERTSEIPHCEEIFEPLSDSMRDACMNAFFKAVNSLHVKAEIQQSPLNSFLDGMTMLADYAETLINATEYVEPKFSIEKVQSSWIELKTVLNKLKKKCKKDNLSIGCNAFQVLFFQLGLYLFQDPDGISEALEELYICCKKFLKSEKQDNDDIKETGPAWISVVVDIFLSLLSKPLSYFRSLVTCTLPYFCPFIVEKSLQQILDVINPKKENEDMLIDEDIGGVGDEQELDFGSDSSSDESEDEVDKQPIDEEFKKRVQEALGPAADDSDAESIVLSDSEMFKLDDALSEAFKSRVKSGHTQMSLDETFLLNFRLRCLDLLLVYLKSEPPMNFVLRCLEPVLGAFETGHQNKHKAPLLHKTVTVLQFMTRMKKFRHHEDVSRTELKRLLDVLIPKCHKEINMSVSQKLSGLCVFIVLCYRKLENADLPDKKKSKTPSYIKIYLSALETFITSGSSHMLPNFFTHLMEACPDTALYFIEPCKNYGFNGDIRLFKRTQCLGLLSESLKYSKSQSDVSDEQWFELANSILPLAIESLKEALESENTKPVYCSELFSIIYTLHSIIKEKTNESILEKYADILPLLNNIGGKKMKKLGKKGISLKNKIIISLGGTVNTCRKIEKSENEKSDVTDQLLLVEGKSAEQNEVMDSGNEDLQNESKKTKKKNKKKKKSNSEISFHNNDHNNSSKELDKKNPEKSELSQTVSKKKSHSQKKRKSTKLEENVTNCGVNEDLQKSRKKFKVSMETNYSIKESNSDNDS